MLFIFVKYIGLMTNSHSFKVATLEYNFTLKTVD